MGIKLGRMGSAAGATTPAEFADSMAAEIERQLVAIMRAEGHVAPKTNDNSRETRDRRMLFVAIARGIMTHLDQQRAAIDVEVRPGETVSPTFEIDDRD
jgi:hypothetical protein